MNVRLGLKVGDLADRLAATWPFAGVATGGVLKIYFRTQPAESLAYLRDRVKLDELTALRLRDGVPNPYPAAPPAAAEATTDALVAHDTSRKRHLADAPGDSPADSCSEAAPMDEPRAADEARLGEGAAELLSAKAMIPEISGQRTVGDGREAHEPEPAVAGAPVSPRCRNSPGASTHDTERLRAESATQRLRIEELEAELELWRGRPASAQQQLLPPCGSSAAPQCELGLELLDPPTLRGPLCAEPLRFVS